MDSIPKYYFDSEDHRLLKIVDEVLHSKSMSRHDTQTLLRPYLHPHGIKTRTSSSKLRVASAVINLLSLLESGQAPERLVALRSLHDEVLSSSGSMRRNTARVLVQIMKTLVRFRGSRLEQLKLAHDFRVAASGRPHFILKQLRKYHLHEMPEEWNQLTFDDRVHDANTKGRKSPTHLVMDAWIKGIRRLTVVYYNYVDAVVVEELLKAAKIMDIEVHVGIEVTALQQGRFVNIIWEPQGFTEYGDYLKFLAQPAVVDFMGEGRKVAQHHNEYVLGLLRLFNSKHRFNLELKLGFAVNELESTRFLDFVGVGQPSTEHLAGYIFRTVFPGMKDRVKMLDAAYRAESDPAERQKIADQVEFLNGIDAEYLVNHYLLPGSNQELVYLLQPGTDDPPLLRQKAAGLVGIIQRLHSMNHLTLNTVNLTQADVIEILYDCQGLINCIEAFNLRDLTQERFRDGEALVELESALNEGDVVALKYLIQDNIGQFCLGDTVCEQESDEVARLREILANVRELADMYRHRPLHSYVGSGSAGYFSRSFGMGFAVLDTLPVRAQKEYAKRLREDGSFCLPMQAEVWEEYIYKPKQGITRVGRSMLSLFRRLPFGKRFVQSCEHRYINAQISVAKGRCGNIGLLGGRKAVDNGFTLSGKQASEQKRKKIPASYLNTSVRNWLKVFAGLVPAFLTFALTKDWWLLSYLGAFIWFGITGVRNIIQAVVGGGGFRGFSLLHWHEYVNWGRVSDSLLFTGFSVPLLDFLCKTILLERSLGVTAANDPVLLYAVMGVTNGFYICSHNLFRGLPRQAALANLFRSILAVPMAILFNWLIGGLLGFCGVVGVGLVLQKWAAVISKLASDCVAGFIEGYADRGANVQMRLWDYGAKLPQVLQLQAQIESYFPEQRVVEMMAAPEDFLQQLGQHKSGLAKAVIFDSLDLLTLWCYQPRSATALEYLLRQMSSQQRILFFMSQLVLTQEKEVSQLLVSGSLGPRFAKALSFYLDRYQIYLRALDSLLEKIGTTEHRQLCGNKPWKMGQQRLGF